MPFVPSGEHEHELTVVLQESVRVVGMRRDTAEAGPHRADERNGTEQVLCESIDGPMEFGFDAVHDRRRVGRDRARMVGHDQRTTVGRDVLEAFPLDPKPMPIHGVIDPPSDLTHVFTATVGIDVATTDLGFVRFEVQSFGPLRRGNQRHAARDGLRGIGEIEDRFGRDGAWFRSVVRLGGIDHLGSGVGRGVVGRWGHPGRKPRNGDRCNSTRGWSRSVVVVGGAAQGRCAPVTAQRSVRNRRNSPNHRTIIHRTNALHSSSRVRSSVVMSMRTPP